MTKVDKKNNNSIHRHTGRYKHMSKYKFLKGERQTNFITVNNQIKVP